LPLSLDARLSRPDSFGTGVVEEEYRRLEFVGLGRWPNRSVTLRLYLVRTMRPPDILVQLGQVGTLVLGSLGVWVQDLLFDPADFVGERDDGNLSIA